MVHSHWPFIHLSYYVIFKNLLLHCILIKHNIVKKLTTLLFTCLITVLSFGQTIHFKQGDEFSYRSSVYVNNVFLCSDKTESNTTESIKCYQVNFKVEESDTSGYILLAEYEELNNYTRSIKGLDKQWKTGTHYEKNLMNKNTTLNFPEYIVEFNLTCKGVYCLT
jgi:hypothetical protein